MCWLPSNLHAVQRISLSVFFLFCMSLQTHGFTHSMYFYPLQLFDTHIILFWPQGGTFWCFLYLFNMAILAFDSFLAFYHNVVSQAQLVHFLELTVEKKRWVLLVCEGVLRPEYGILVATWLSLFLGLSVDS